ncbi:YiiX/YebB-like N1pC/P60 family cysteine hydrolase [Flavobacterium sp. DGU11]|uniref:YiiX/YebB-like N1pC/P60 family cysteine hydrolase n=1 Tax=Flavobacterium arundinis TaxID=3139143 RepID=A0ABU9HZJ0_9FLAO
MRYLALLFLVFTTVVSAQKSEGDSINFLKDGDLIFQDMDCGALCDAIEAVTEGYNGNDFSHMGMVYFRNDTLYIIEAAGSAVRLSTLEKFSKNTNKPMPVFRLKNKYRKLIPTAITFSLKQVGVPYDDEYVYDNGSYYCSELIYDAFKLANKNKPFFELFPMTYKQPGTDEFFPAWVEYYKSISKPIPEGLPGCNPGGMSVSDKIELVGSL